MIRPTVALVVTTVAVGLASAWLWAAVTPLPGYTVHPGGQATTTERGLTEFVLGDVVFSALGLVGGVGLGIVAWRGFGRRLGWPAVPIGVGAALLAGVLCWQVGQAIGPRDFSARLAAASVGDTVPIDLHLRATVALAVWVLGACGAVLVATAALRDPDQPYPVRLPWSAHGPESAQGGPGGPGAGEQAAPSDGDQVSSAG